MTLSYDRSALLDDFSEHYKALVRYLRHRTGNDEDAQELAHDTWLRLAEHDAKVSDEPRPSERASAKVRDPRAYLYSIAANLDLDRLRRVKWAQNHLQERVSTGSMSPHTPDVAEQVMYRQALAAVEAALGGLPERGRQVWRACRIYEESQPAVAARLGVALNTIERDLIAADRRVEAALRRWRGESPVEIADAVHRKASSGTRRKGLVSLLAFAGLGTTGTFLWRLWKAHAQDWQAAYASPRGRGLVQPLPDGSVVTLDADTRAEFSFNAGYRTVHLLKGAAFFAVQRDELRPFVVQAGDVVVTVLGTRFGVDIAGNGDVLVQVESGRVQVTSAEGSTELSAGNGLRIAPAGDTQPVSGAAASWRDGVLRFDARSLGEVVERLARYARFELSVDEATAPLRISGNVEIAHAVDWLKSLPSALPVRIVREDGGAIRIAAR